MRPGTRWALDHSAVGADPSLPRFLDLLFDDGVLPWWTKVDGYKGTIKGHQGKMSTDRGYLRRLITNYESRDDCDDFPGPKGKVPQIYKGVSNLPVPRPLARQHPPAGNGIAEHARDVLRILAALSAGSAAGYGGYRLARLTSGAWAAFKFRGGGGMMKLY